MYKSEKLDIEIRMLGRILGEVIREQAGMPLYDLEEEIRLTARARRLGDPDAEKRLLDRIQSMTTAEARTVARAFTLFFDLANLAEDRQRVRVLRDRERNQAPEPRSESIAAVIDHFKSAGYPAEKVRELLRGLSIELVFTAHPTEAKRRSVRVKVRHLREYLTALDRENLLPREQEHLLTQIRMYMAGLWQTDLLRVRRPTVLEEVEVGLYFTSTLWEVIPSLYRDMRRALGVAYPGEHFDLPPFLRVGSWIGGDRDGNPFVTSDVTAQTFLRLRRAAVEAHLAQCFRAFDSLSPSSRQVGVSERLREAVDAACASYPQVQAAMEPLAPSELYRRYLKFVEWRLRQTLATEAIDHPPAGAYRAGNELREDLELIAESLREHKGLRILDGDLQDWIWQVESFGLRLARLDIRQESSWNARVAAELLSALGVEKDYSSLSERERVERLTRTMDCTQPLDESRLSDEARETLALFRTVRAAVVHFGEEALGGYVISMTHHLSDVLAVLWLFSYAAASAREQPQAITSAMSIIPLFETIDDLSRAGDILEAMLSHPLYREHVRLRGDVQTVMIGYSDSTKDGGYLAANWSLYSAQSMLYERARSFGVRAVFFHGRGGSLGRGGGPAARSILALPPQTVSAGLRMTEQGEVLADRYDDPQIAYRHLEQLLWASLMAAGRPLAAPKPEWTALIERLAAKANEAYRRLVESDGFLAYFGQATPIEEIEALPIASRPARRHGERRLEDLRAIPWVFAWTQSRHLIPAWYGIGSAFRAAAGSESGGWQLLREMYEEWAYFRAAIDNAVLALSKTDINIAFHYAGLVEDANARARIWKMIKEEYDASREAVLRVNGQTELLAEIPWLDRSIQVRNPNTDPLNFIQIEWLRRLRAVEQSASPEEIGELHDLLRLTIQGLASGMRTTG